MDALELDRREPIAVTGIGCRFPGHANDPAAFWRLLRDGVDAITEVPRSRWDIDRFYDPDPDAPGKTYTRFGGFIDGVDTFDPHFFGISPREARSIDPQHRLILEVAWEALEDAGVVPADLQRTRTGVFVGITASDYAGLLKDAGAEHLDAYHLTGCSLSFVAGRLAHILGLQGPAVALDTACSSSLVALHLACQSLRAGDCDLAIVGGVNALLTPETFITAAKARMLASDGRCKTFDARANGYVRGEGCGVVVLKRQRDAVAAGDRILALVRGSAVNQDGPSSGLTVPNKLAQEALIRHALTSAGVPPAQVGCVEAHGTGTPLGDPIEVRALAAVLGEGRGADDRFLLGSVKTNVGHLESAAGIAGFIKAVLALDREAVPAHLHFETPNPMIEWSEVPARIPTQLTPWPRGERPRIAAVSSFGGSGTNAHVVLEEGPRQNRPAVESDRPVHVLTLSARTPKALDAFAVRVEQHLAAGSDTLADVAFAVNTGRTAFAERAAVIASTVDEARAALTTHAHHESSTTVVSGRVSASSPKVAFLFTGQGAQHVGMGRALYETQPIFRAALDRCAAVLQPVLERPLLSVMFGESDADAKLLDGTDYTQPALFAIEWALAELLDAWGIRPAAVLGHSVGEYVAACRAGLFSLEGGLTFIARRARLMADLPPGGAMAAVFAPEDRLLPLVSRTDGVSIAALNGPENTVIAGPSERVAELQRQLELEGVRSRSLVVSHAFHSALLDPMLDALEAAAAQLRFQEPQIPIVSNLTGRRASFDELSRPAYWRNHARNPVRFAQGIAAVRDLGCEVFVEIGPAPVLLGMGARCLAANAGLWLPTLRQGSEDWPVLARTVATLWVNGAPVDWSAFDRPYPRRRVFAPAGPFERERVWPDPPASSPRRRAAASATGSHPLLATRVRTAVTSDAIFEAELSPDVLSCLDHHRISGVSVLPAAAYVDAMLAAARLVHGPAASQLVDLTIQEMCAVPDGTTRVMQLVIGPMRQDGSACRVFSAPLDRDDHDNPWTLHASATIRTITAGHDADAKLDELRRRIADVMSPDAHYARLAKAGLTFGPTFRVVSELWRAPGEALARIEPIAPAHPGAVIDPAALDACLQAVAPLVIDETSMSVPTGMARCTVHGTASGPLWSHASVRSITADNAVVDLAIVDAGGRRVASVEQMTLRRINAAALAARGAQRDNLFTISWERLESTSGSDVVTWCPGVPALFGRVNDRVNPLDDTFGVAAFDRYLPELNRLATVYMAGALRELGWRPRVGEIVSSEALADQLGILPAHRRFVDHILRLLGEDGVLSASEGGWRVHSLPAAVDINALEATLTQSNRCEAELGLMTRVGRELPVALRGNRDVIDLLFPGGSLTLAERLYEQSPLFAPYNAAIRETVIAAVAAVPAGRRVRILEIGAGTGATASRLLPHLPAQATEYTFSDVSTLFLAKAREKFKAYPFVDYKLLDIERDPAAQGFADHGFDIIVAANVLHATLDLRTTLQHVHRLLAPGGLLVLLEGAKPLRVGDLIVGLTDGWWRFRDVDLRPTHALLAPEGWRELLHTVGFAESATWPAAHQDGALAHHMVVAARTSAMTQSDARPALNNRGTWLVLADAHGLGDRIASHLTAQGARVVTVRPGAALTSVGESRFEIDPASPDQFRALIHTIRSSDPAGCAAVVHGWSLDLDRTAPPDEALLLGTASALHLVQALEREESTSSALWILTRGAQPAGVADPPVNAAQAPIWGLANTIAREYPELRCTRLDLEWPAADDEAQRVCRELLSASADEQIAMRGGERYVARVVPAPPSPGARSLEPEQLFVEAPGKIDGVAFRPTPRIAPPPGEVEIAVDAAGLNFRDVLRALGVYPDDRGEALGVECAGRIAAVGAGVTEFHVGQRVVAIATGSVGTFVTTPAQLAAPLPDSLSPSEGATIPSALLTAQYGLVTLANLRKGERVLIHAAAGGVGLAAVQVAQRLGAEVYATAGSPRKRGFLRSLGVTHVFDSRTPTFARDVMAASGDGVDVVLNSLSGEFIRASVEVLRPTGRFIELGRRDIWTDAQFRAVRPAGAYHLVNLAETCRTEPELAGSLLRTLMHEVSSGALRPLPFVAFPSDAVTDAFRHMAQARHIGKIVITRAAAAWTPDSRGSYLITGALSGVGLRVADWLVTKGARHLVLMGRRAPTPEALAAIASMQERGATVIISRGDVSRLDDVRATLALVPNDAPLRGVMHCAGVLDDGVVSQLDRNRLATVMAPKVDGSRNLHELTRALPLDCFVLFSSAVSILGSAGQANHAAACAYQDALAWERVANGLPACSINWGPWSDIGSVVRQNVGDRLKTRGITPFTPEEGLAALETVLRGQSPQVIVIRADWSAYVRDVGGPRQAPLFEQVMTRTVDAPGTVPAEQKSDLADVLQAATPAEGRRRLQSHVQQQIAAVLGLRAGFRFEPHHGLRDLGIDSLMSIELRNRLQAAFGKSLPSTLVFDYPTVDAVTDFLGRQLFGNDGAAAGRSTDPEVDRRRDADLAEISQLSQEDAEALLLEELSRVNDQRTV